MTLTLVNFEAQREAITALFCINKEKPELNCKGLCYLKKQIKADEDAHSEKPQSRVELTNPVFIITDFLANPSPPTVPLFKHQFSYIIPSFSGGSMTIFHPPKFI